MTLKSQLRIEYHKMTEEEEEYAEKKKRKPRQQHPSVGEGNRARQKEKRRVEDEERQRLTEAQCPYVHLSIPELKELIRGKTGKRTLIRTREALLDVLWKFDNLPDAETEQPGLYTFSSVYMIQSDDVCDTSNTTKCHFDIFHSRRIQK